MGSSVGTEGAVLLSSMVPEPSQVTNEELQECRELGNFNKPLFNLYVWTATACHHVASEVLRGNGQVEQLRTTIAGLTQRCAMLMHGNLYLTRESCYGDVAAVVDRCIAETAINIRWILKQDTDDRLRRFLAEGLKKDLLLEDMMGGYVAQHDGEVNRIEARMRSSIVGTLERAGLTVDEVRDTKGLPTFMDRCKDVGLIQDFYMAVQRMGGHAVHGAWANLLCYYFKSDGQGGLALQDELARLSEIA